MNACASIDSPACICVCIYGLVCACSPLPLPFECYQDECVPYVCQLRSLSETGEVKGEKEEGKGVETPIHVDISLWVTEHLRPEVRKKELHCFWEEVIDESGERCSLGRDGWMEIIFF